MTVNNTNNNAFIDRNISQNTISNVYAKNTLKGHQLDQALAKVEKIDFREQLSKLKKGIAVAWFINFLILALTLQSAFIVVMNDTFSSNIQGFFLITGPLSLIAALIVTLIVSHYSYKTILLTASPKAQKVEQGPVFNLVEEMCVAGGIKQQDYPIVYIDPTNEPNAYALSSPQGTLVIITEGLLKILNREQLQAVIAHELGHLVSGDSKAMTKIIAMTSFVSFLSGGFKYIFYSGGNRNNNNNNPIAIIITIIALIFLAIAPLLSAIANAFMSRQRESQADAMAVRLTRNPTALAEALIKIDQSYQQLSHNTHSASHHSSKDKKKLKEAHKFSDGAGHLAFFSFKKGLKTHPPTNERIQALRSMGAEIN